MSKLAADTLMSRKRFLAALTVPGAFVAAKVWAKPPSKATFPSKATYPSRG